MNSKAIKKMGDGSLASGTPHLLEGSGVHEAGSRPDQGDRWRPLLLAVSFTSLVTTIQLPLSPPAWAEAEGGDEKPTLQDRARESLDQSDRTSFLTLTIENDMFGSGEDNNYTSGVQLTYFDIGQNAKSIGRRAGSVIPFFEANETTAVSYSFGQAIFTPNDIELQHPQPEDRPWAAFLYGTVGVSTLIGNRVDDVELTAGIIGPEALGEQSQSLIHDIVGSPKPMGWDHQLKTEPGVVFSWRRRWPEYVHHEIGGWNLSLQPSAGFSLGNVYTLASGGITLQVSPSQARWQDTPIRVRPSIPGSGYFASDEGNSGWLFFVGLQGRAVARNLFLDGNTFTDSPSVDKEPFVLDANAGVAWTVGHVRLSFSAIYRTREFKTQQDDTLFGAISVAYRF